MNQRMRVPLVDLAAQHAPLEPDLDRALYRVRASHRFVLGPEVAAFEAEVAASLGVVHAIGVSSGSDALLAALMALEIGPGDEVVTTPFTFFATAAAALRLGATLSFVDIDPNTLNLDVNRLEAAMTPRTRAIVPVHLFGRPVAMDAVGAIASRYDVAVVEDAAQAFGARYLGRSAGAWGTFGCFSFFPSKPLGAFGDGGLIVTSDAALAAHCRRIRQHGAADKHEHLEIGGNFRLDELQAAVLRVKLPHAAFWAAERRAHAAAFDRALGGVSGVRLLAPATAGFESAAAHYTIRVTGGRRSELARHLADKGVETAVHYPRPLHRQPALEVLGVQSTGLEESERAAAEVLSLPLYAGMTDEQREYVVASIREFLG